MSVQKQLAAHAAFETLSDEDKAALEAISKPERLELYSSWVPTDEQLTEASKTPMNVLMSAVHLLSPEAVARISYGVDSARIYFTLGEKKTEEVNGFTRQGYRASDEAFDPLNVATVLVSALTQGE